MAENFICFRQINTSHIQRTSSNMHVHFIVHESFEAPGAYETWALERGFNITFTRLFLGDILLIDVGSLDALIVLGGPQTPSTTKDECPYFDAAAEKIFHFAIHQCGEGCSGHLFRLAACGRGSWSSLGEKPRDRDRQFPHHSHHRREKQWQIRTL